MAANGSIMGLIGTATVVNVYGATKHGKPIDRTIIASFVVLIFLLAIAETKAERLAVMFALAYTITTFSIIGTDLLNLAVATTGGTTVGNSTPNSRNSVGASAPGSQRKV